jgi:hypothetical protein
MFNSFNLELCARPARHFYFQDYTLGDYVILGFIRFPDKCQLYVHLSSHGLHSTQRILYDEAV